MDQLGSFAGAFLLVFLAEFGDKSQLVCMTLATRYRPLPVIFAAVVAFSVLNVLAVVVGSVAATWLPRSVVLTVVAVLFLWFGLQSFRAEEDEESGALGLSGKSVFLSALMMLFLAELGDKTQLAVMGLASTESPMAVWLGATLALIATSVIGVIAGRALMRYVSVVWLHRVSGVLFILFGIYAASEAISLLL
ncbi:TMEM165/GDT1 family protein [Amphritea sp. 2_MG-2023]|uniref:TMEM165/GDT1 family protein n=1 Tax=Amphritea TaxID=515417 RepID=UPI001C076491|nr:MULTISPECIES: TMEM165/GDT1 family protein [Amphritea]MBU2965214.1 TMEM165/GDT1 family protein [Amphritea atlantica]MDO6419717.1 TMEM165/GDT1 family protein [Amphritea sp. 2_MG-2023]